MAVLGGLKGGLGEGGPEMGEGACTIKSVWMCLNHNSTSAYTVPFLSRMDAEVARRYLAPLAEHYRGAVHWDVTVTGSDLAM